MRPFKLPPESLPVMSFPWEKMCWTPEGLTCADRAKLWLLATRSAPLAVVSEMLLSLGTTRTSTSCDSCRMLSGRGHKSLPLRQARRIGGELVQAVEEIRELRAHIVRALKTGLRLLQLLHFGVELPLLLRFLVQTQFENVVTYALRLPEYHSRTEHQRRQFHRNTFVKHCA